MTDEELIDYVYYQSIEADKPIKITDLNTWHQWMDSTHQLSHNAQMSYRIVSLHNQVLNGGLMQYFDNRYGIYAYETLDDLSEIGAKKVWELLSKALSVVNPDNYSGEQYFDLIYYQPPYSERPVKLAEMIDEELEKLDFIYYHDIDFSKDLIKPLADYFRLSHPSI